MAAEIRVGGIMKASLVPDDGVGYTNMADDWYEPDTQLGTVNLSCSFGTLFVSVGPGSKHCYIYWKKKLSLSNWRTSYPASLTLRMATECSFFRPSSILPQECCYLTSSFFRRRVCKIILATITLLIISLSNAPG
jgi:hypothetical protein